MSARAGRMLGAEGRPALKIIYKSLAQLMPRAGNPRTHTKKQIQQIATSIKEFGFINPILIDGADGIVAGHGRVEAAKLLGMKDVPTVSVEHLTPAQIRAYVIADNKLAENAGWDRTLLALELQELSVELNFDVTVTGFETIEVDQLIQKSDEGARDEADEVSETDRSIPSVSRAGDIWRIGDHVLLCGDALDRHNYVTLLGAQKAEMVFIDPPSEVAIAGNVSNLGRVKHREFAKASGELRPDQYTNFLETAFSRLIDFSASGSIHFVCMDWRRVRELLNAATNPYGELKDLCVWSKTDAGMGGLYRSGHELVFVFKNGTAEHITNMDLGRNGRHRTNVWHHGGPKTFGGVRNCEFATHPALKPVALIADAVLDCSKRGGIVLDAFAGSGSTLIAAEKTGRRGFGIEIDPYCVDTIVRRFDTVYGLKAVHAGSDLDFATVSRRRSKETNDDQKGKKPAIKGQRRRKKDR
jgi:DNA modification methylase